jgi:hypothetical protein
VTQVAFSAIRDECNLEELPTLSPKEVLAAQSILGVGGWITANKSLEATFAYTVLASRVAHY